MRVIHFPLLALLLSQRRSIPRTSEFLPIRFYSYDMSRRNVQINNTNCNICENSNLASICSTCVNFRCLCLCRFLVFPCLIKKLRDSKIDVLLFIFIFVCAQIERILYPVEGVEEFERFPVFEINREARS
jgi:hypothetical protein